MIVKENMKEKVHGAQDIDDIMRPILNARPENEAHKEYFYMIGLDGQNRIVIIDLISIGTINECCPHIREIFRMAIIKNCISIIIVHNHPSGVTKPSTQDNKFTKEVKEGGSILGVELLDHVIIGDNYFSYADSGIV